MREEEEEEVERRLQGSREQRSEGWKEEYRREKEREGSGSTGSPG